MNGWRLFVPANVGRERKTRLAGRYPPEWRERLADLLFDHVVDAGLGCPAVAAVTVVSPERPARGDVLWCADEGRGLNAELEAAARAAPPGPLLVVHADLPLLTADDLTALIAAAGKAGAAIASDRAGEGTNALALAKAAVFFAHFGPGSFAAHRALYPQAALVQRDGLAFDVDYPADLDALAGRLLPDALAALLSPGR